MINTQTGDMVLTLCKMYLRITKHTNHHLHLDNNSLYNLYNRIPWGIWSNKFLLKPLSVHKQITIPLPFPSRVVQARNFEIDDELLQTFNKEEVEGQCRVGRNVLALIKSKQLSTLVQPAMLNKCNASTNVMPSLVYRSLRLGTLEPTGILIQLENRSTTHPLSILEDMLVQVDMIFPTNI
ncbi:hypothetical protein CR513_36725, partial [Mucuna pruriens]